MANSTTPKPVIEQGGVGDEFDAYWMMPPPIRRQAGFSEFALVSANTAAFDYNSLLDLMRSSEIGTANEVDRLALGDRE